MVSGVFASCLEKMDAVLNVRVLPNCFYVHFKIHI